MTSSPSARLLNGLGVFLNSNLFAFLTFSFGSGLVLFVFSKVFRLGELNREFRELKKRFGGFESKLEKLCNYIMARDGTTTLELYSRPGSPMVLKEEFKEMIKSSGLADQISERLEELCNLVREENPETELDAQDVIARLVAGGGITRYLDLKKFKQSLYAAGEPSSAVVPILTLYLSELIIPKLELGR